MSNKEECEAVRGFVAWYVAEKAEIKWGIFIQKNPLILVCSTHRARSQAIHGQRFVVTHSSLFCTQLQNGATIQGIFGYPLFLGSFLVSFIPHMDRIPSWDRAVPCYLPCANGRCSCNPLRFCLLFSFPRQCFIHLGAAHSHRKPQPFPLPDFWAVFLISHCFLSALNTGFMPAQLLLCGDNPMTWFSSTFSV